MQTMSAVNVTVTAILGGVLLFTWARERDSAFVGWWGLALVIMSAGVIVSSFPVRPHADLLHLGLTTIALSDALKWKAAQEFALGAAVPLSKGKHKVSVRFTNDKQAGSEDRNLFVGAVGFARR